MGCVVDYPLLILLFVLDDSRKGCDSPVFSKPSLELAEGHLLHEALLDVFFKLSSHKLAVRLLRGVV